MSRATAGHLHGFGWILGRMETREQVEKRAKSAKMEAGLMMLIGAVLALWGLYGIVARDGVPVAIAMAAVGILVGVLGSKRYTRATDLTRGADAS